MSSNKKNYIEEVVQNVHELLVTHKIPYYPVLLGDIVKSIFEYRTFTGNINNTVKTQDIKELFNKYIIFSKLIHNKGENSNNILSNVSLNRIKYSNEANVKSELSAFYPALTNYKLYNEYQTSKGGKKYIQLQKGGKRVIHTGSRGGKYYMKGGRKVYI